MKTNLIILEYDSFGLQQASLSLNPAKRGSGSLELEIFPLELLQLQEMKE